MAGYPNIIYLLLFSIFFVLTGCKTTPAAKFAEGKDKKAAQNQKAEPEKKLPVAQSFQISIGTVHMVDQVGKFVLVKSNRATSLEPGTEIVSYGPDSRVTSNLKVSPARKGAYLTADLVQGTPSVGDIVMMVHSTGNAPEPTGVAGLESGNVQVLE
ncbi:MAG: hypothetical protein P1U89_10800 [Verrucomicrobiales bacterium]|nr:hypothetical protein [Verrucomicrobiales bacterium]